VLWQRRIIRNSEIAKYRWVGSNEISKQGREIVAILIGSSREERNSQAS
jgi:hypothetical protein